MKKKLAAKKSKKILKNKKIIVLVQLFRLVWQLSSEVQNCRRLIKWISQTTIRTIKEKKRIQSQLIKHLYSIVLKKGKNEIVTLLCYVIMIIIFY